MEKHSLTDLNLTEKKTRIIVDIFKKKYNILIRIKKHYKQVKRTKHNIVMLIFRSNSLNLLG